MTGQAAATSKLPWPAASLAEIESRLCAPGEPFEMETVSIGGIPTRTWKNLPPNLGEAVRQTRDAYATREFIVFEDERVTYEGWYRAIARLALELERRGIRKGDRVGLAMRNLPEWPVAFFAIAALGAIVVPLNAWWEAGELRHGLSDSGCRMLIADSVRWRRIRQYVGELPQLTQVIVARPDAEELQGAEPLEQLIGHAAEYGNLAEAELPEIAISPDDDATIFYTSGTTGLPKGALGTHRNILTCPMSQGYAAQRTILRRGDPLPEPEPRVGLLTIPLFHVTGCHAVMLSTMASGSKMVMMRRWDAVEAFKLIEREKVTHAGGVPAVAWQLIEHPGRHDYDLSSLESISYGGAPAAPELVRRIGSDMRSQPGSGWGMTETSATVTSHSAEDYLHRPESCGPPVPVSRLRIMSTDGERELPVGEVGELWASGPQIIKGYWNNPKATAETFVDGWVKSGDLARLDEEGFCYIVDRAKDMLIRGGENIYSSEVENALYDHAAVTDVAVVGIPHRILGEEPAAVVHLAPGAKVSEAELQVWVRERLAAFKVPVRILFSSATLPRNANGKIVKSAIREMFD